MSEHTSTKRIGRRSFLSAVAVAGAAAAVGAACKASDTKEAAPSTELERSAQSYRETAHIRRYYETARL